MSTDRRDRKGTGSNRAKGDLLAMPAKNGSEPLLLAGGTVVDPSRGFSGSADVLLEGGRVTGVDRPGAFESSMSVRRIDVGGLLVMPGLIDMHVHLREPGFEYKETIQTGTAAAVAGGFTSVACMANTDPPNDSAAVTKYILDRARLAGSAEVYPIGALSLGLRGQRMAEIGEMHQAGIVAVSDDGRPVADGALMRRALEYCKLFDMPVIAHEEDPYLAAAGVMNEGATAVRLGLRGLPAVAEEAMIARDVALAEVTGGRLHVAHVSASRSVELIRDARARGVDVTAEAAAHHLWLTEEAVGDYETHAKINPPLRGENDLRALRKGVADGTIEAIASDHAPHHRDEKEVEFEAAAMGIVGLETTLPLVLALVRAREIGLQDAVARLTTGPARILRIPRGSLEIGAVANVTVVDPEMQWTVDAKNFRSKGRNTAFDGWRMKGRAVLTIVAGRVAYQCDARSRPARRRRAESLPAASSSR